jgi:rare lipoprotein A
MKRTIKILAALLLFQPAAFAHHSGNHGRTVTATVYDEWFHNRTTYCGDTYIHWNLSAAHPWLPCGTNVRVSHKGRTINVKITDRCDCQLDLSAGAAHKLGVPLNGIAVVRIK